MFKHSQYKYYIGILFILLLFIKPSIIGSIDSFKLITYSSVVFIAILLHFDINKSHDKNWFRIDVFFLIGFFIVHFQWPIMYSISNLIPDMPSRVWVDEMYVNYGTWLSSIGILSWILGYSILRNSTSLFKKNKKTKYKYNYSKLLYLTIFFFVLFIFTAGKDYLIGGAYKVNIGNESSLDSGIQLPLSVSIIALTAVVINASKDKYHNNIIKWFFKLDKKFLILYISYLIVYLGIGNRGGPITLLLTTAILVGTLIRPFKFSVLLLSIVIGGLFFSIISIGRSQSHGLELLLLGKENFEFTSIYDFTLELANSVRTLYTSVSNVPSNHDYFYGKLWLTQFLAVIPFLQSFIVDLFQIPSYELGSAGYITYLTFGVGSVSGEGTSLIADIYLNFGPFGVFLFMLLFGLFIKKINNELQSNNYYWIVSAAVIAGFSIYFSRSTLFVFIRPVTWSLLLIFFFVKRRSVSLYYK